MVAAAAAGDTLLWRRFVLLAAAAAATVRRNDDDDVITTGSRLQGATELVFNSSGEGEFAAWKVDNATSEVDYLITYYVSLFLIVAKLPDKVWPFI